MKQPDVSLGLVVEAPGPPRHGHVPMWNLDGAGDHLQVGIRLPGFVGVEEGFALQSLPVQDNEGSHEAGGGVTAVA